MENWGFRKGGEGLEGANQKKNLKSEKNSIRNGLKGIGNSKKGNL